MPYVMLILFPAGLVAIGICNYRRIWITARNLVEQCSDD